MLKFTVLILSSQMVKAHIIGNNNWCLSYTEQHWECVYSTNEHCSEMLSSVTKMMKSNSSFNFSETESKSKVSDPKCFHNPQIQNGNRDKNLVF